MTRLPPFSDFKKVSARAPRGSEPPPKDGPNWGQLLLLSLLVVVLLGALGYFHHHPIRWRHASFPGGTNGVARLLGMRA